MCKELRQLGPMSSRITSLSDMIAAFVGAQGRPMSSRWNRGTLILRNTLLSVCVCTLVACGPQTPEERMSAARDAMADGDPRAAEIYLKNLLLENPDDGDAHQLYGELLLAVGDPAGAEHSLRRSVELGIPSSSVRLPLLRALIGQGKFSDALAMIAAGSDLPAAEELQLKIIAGMAHQGLGSIAEAEAAYRAALDIDPDSPLARSELAGFLLDMGRDAEAVELISAVLDNEPDFARALFLRGVTEHSSGRYAAADASFKKALSADSADRRTRLAALARLVETQLAMGNVTDANVNAELLLSLNPYNPVARYLKAKVEFEQKDLDAAARRLQGLLAAVPNYGPAYTLLGNISRVEGQMSTAIMYLRAAIENYPPDPAARLLLAETYIGEGDVESAKSLFDDTASPGALDGLFLASAGLVNVDRGQPDIAADYFDRSEDSEPGSVQELVQISSIYLAAGEFERTIRVLQESSLDDSNSNKVRDYLLALIQLRRGDLPAARTAATRLVEAQPNAAWSLNLLGTIDLLSQDLAAARETYLRALKSEPDDVPTLLNLARVEVASNDNDRAGRLLRQVLEIKTGELTALVGLAQLAAKRGDLEEAHSWLSKGSEAPVLLQLQGELFTQQSRYREAAATFSRAFELQPSGELALKAYAVATRAGAPEPESALRTWVASHPDDVSANFVLGLLAQAAADNDAAIKHYESILNVDPAHTASLNNLAGLYSQRGDQRALELAARAHVLQPDDPAIADTLGWLYVMNDDADAALPLLEQAAAGLPDSLDIRYHLAVAITEARGDSERGMRELRDLLESGAAFPSRADAQSYLARLESSTDR